MIGFFRSVKGGVVILKSVGYGTVKRLELIVLVILGISNVSIKVIDVAKAAEKHLYANYSKHYNCNKLAVDRAL